MFNFSSFGVLVCKFWEYPHLGGKYNPAVVMLNWEIRADRVYSSREHIR